MRAQTGRMLMNARLIKAGGFTLVELMIASVILALLLTSIGLFFGNMIEQSDKMDDMTRALELCQQGLEEFRTEDVHTLPDGVVQTDTVDKFTREIILGTPDPSIPSARTVKCRLGWTGAGGPDSTSLTTIY
ncbi:prepilin-type N-terminal cleavage/methylation domain-containing protein [Candidatus Fermentibacteria bacterium]|nr:prepilin-type N-terminal cleavage/methylation domain-containing protein [Candidatus Fermentibacteria bacterium]